MSETELKTATLVCSDINYGKRVIAGELGTEDLKWEVEYVPDLHKVRLTGTRKD